MMSSKRIWLTPLILTAKTEPNLGTKILAATGLTIL
jgi:hypothetical protein